MPPTLYNITELILSYFIMPASMIPPNTNLAMSTKNLPVSDNIVSFRFCLMLQI